MTLAVTMGDPAGIGGELTLQAWRARRDAGLPAFAAFDDPRRLHDLARVLGWSVPLAEIDCLEEAARVRRTAGAARRARRTGGSGISQPR